MITQNLKLIIAWLLLTVSSLSVFAQQDCLFPNIDSMLNEQLTEMGDDSGCPSSVLSDSLSWDQMLEDAENLQPNDTLWNGITVDELQDFYNNQDSTSPTYGYPMSEEQIVALTNMLGNNYDLSELADCYSFNCNEINLNFTAPLDSLLQNLTQLDSIIGTIDPDVLMFPQKKGQRKFPNLVKKKENGYEKKIYCEV